MIRVRLLAVFDLAHKIKIVPTTDGSGRRSDDGRGDEGDDGRRHHQYPQKSAGFGNGRHDVVCEEEKKEKKRLGCILFAHNLFL